MTEEITLLRIPACEVRVGDQVVLDDGLAYPVEAAHNEPQPGMVAIVLGCLPRNMLRLYTKVTLLDVAR